MKYKVKFDNKEQEEEYKKYFSMLTHDYRMLTTKQKVIAICRYANKWSAGVIYRKVRPKISLYYLRMFFRWLKEPELTCIQSNRVYDRKEDKH